MLEMFLRGRRNYYKCIVVSRPHNMKILQSMMLAHPDWFGNIRIVYDAEALFSRRDAMLQKLTGTPWSVREVQEELDKEIALASAAHCVISVSARESAEFSQNGIRNVHVIGHAIDADPQPVQFELRSGLLFVGAIHSETSPNADSMIWFLTEVFPKIQKKLGDTIGLTIAGVNKSVRIRNLAGPSVRITGYLPDLTELYANARLFIAPTRYAAGLPHKIHEAAARGLPVVATPLLAGQLEWTERELAIAADAEYVRLALLRTLHESGSVAEQAQRRPGPGKIGVFPRKFRQVRWGHASCRGSGLSHHQETPNGGSLPQRFSLTVKMESPNGRS